MFNHSASFNTTTIIKKGAVPALIHDRINDTKRGDPKCRPDIEKSYLPQH